MVDERLAEQDKLLAELLLRISTVEKLLIDKKIISLDEYNDIFTKSVARLMDVLKEQGNIQKPVIPDGVIKH